MEAKRQEPEALRCAHCGDPLPPTPISELIAGSLKHFCCAGCAQVSRLIHVEGLADFYRLRGQEGAPRPPSALPDYSAWDGADWLVPYLRTLEGGRLGLRLGVAGLRCAACGWLIRQRLLTIPGVERAELDMLSGALRLVWDPAKVRLSTILIALAELGYSPVLPGDPKAAEQARAAHRSYLKRLAVAALGSLQAMMFTEALYLDFAGTMPLPTRDVFRWLAFLLTTPVVFYAGAPFLSGMVRELRLGAPGMDTLIASGTLAAYFGSLIETLRGGPHVWYDAASMFVFFLLIARYLEFRKREQARGLIEAIAGAERRPALRVRPDGTLEAVDPRELSPGDIVEVPIGELVPADGSLLTDADMDESLLTGESLPVHRRAGELAYGGSAPVGSSVRIAIQRPHDLSTQATLAHLAERALAQRTPESERAERIAVGFVSAILLIALLTSLAWALIDPSRAFEVTLAVLVVTCPCALSLAMPAARSAALTTLARRGIIAIRPRALANLARADYALFDKTGTLTDGAPQLISVRKLDDTSPDEAVAIAAALVGSTTHPLRNAFGPSNGRKAERIRYFPGRGVDGLIQGKLYRLGHSDFVLGSTTLRLVRVRAGLEPLAEFTIEDQPRRDAVEALRALKALGLRIEIASGDAPDRVKALAGVLGVDRWKAALRAEEKFALLRQRREEGHRVLAVGDGTNDAILLAGADVSIALAEGAALASRSADFVLLGAGLNRIPEAIRLARRYRRILRQNLGRAIAYNLIALPFAVFGLVAPWLAALGMALSSLTVTLNSARLLERPASAGGRRG